MVHSQAEDENLFPKFNSEELIRPATTAGLTFIFQNQH